MKFVYIFLIFAQNIDCRYTLDPPQCGSSNVSEAVLMSTHNLSFKSKNKKPEDQWSCKRSPDILD